MPYTPQTWADNDPAYPASATRFTYMEQGIQSAAVSAEKSVTVVDRILLRGVQTAANNVLPPGLVFPTGTALTRIDLAIGTAPTGSALSVAVRQGAVVLGTASIVAGQTAGSTVLSSPSTVSASTPVVFDVTAIGSTVPGSDLLVVLTTNSSITSSVSYIPFNTPGASSWDSTYWAAAFGTSPGSIGFTVPSAGVGRITGSPSGTAAATRLVTDTVLPLTATSYDFTGAINMDNRANTDGNLDIVVRATARDASYSRQGLRLQWNTGAAHFEMLLFQTGTPFSTVTANLSGWMRFRVRATGTTLQSRIWTDGQAEPGTWDLTATSSVAPAGTVGFTYQFGNTKSVDLKDLQVIPV